MNGADIDGDGEDDTLEFQFNLVQERDISSEIPVFTQEADKPSNNILYAFQGKNKSYTIVMDLYDNGEDKSNGTWQNLDVNDPRISSTDGDGNEIVQTVEEQIVYLDEYMQNPVFGANWRMEEGIFQGKDGEGIPVGFENFDSKEISENPLEAEAVLVLEVGNII